MQTFIPDASTLLKWVLPAANEAFLQQAAALRMTFVQGRVELLVPGLWVYEVGNTLARRHPESAGQRLDAIRKLGMREIHPDDAMIQHILELASRHKVTFYDAAWPTTPSPSNKAACLLPPMKNICKPLATNLMPDTSKTGYDVTPLEINNTAMHREL